MKKSRILVIHHGALGDVVCAFPAILRLRNLYGPVDMICQGSIGQLAHELLVVNQWFPLETAALASLYSDHVHPDVKNNLLSYDKIILFSRSDSLKKTLVSISEHNVYRIPPRPDPDQKIHVARHILWNLEGYGLLESTDENTRSMLSLPVCRGRGTSHNDPSDIIIHPGSGSRKKCWPISNFINVASSLYLKGYRPTFVLGPAEYDLYDILMQSEHVGDNIRKPENLTELAKRLRTSGGFVGNDSGVSHLAAFMGLPTVAVFGPSDPDVWKPVGRAVKVVGPSLECSPCFETGTVECEEPDCFHRITPEDVLAAFYELMG